MANKIDFKETIWYRMDIPEELSQEEVIEHLKKGEENFLYEYDAEGQYLFNSAEPMDPIEHNRGQATIEIVDRENRTLWHNGLKDKISLDDFLGLLDHPRCIAIRIDQDMLVYPAILEYEDGHDIFMHIEYFDSDDNLDEIAFAVKDNLEIPYEHGIFKLKDDEGETYEIELLTNLLG